MELATQRTSGVAAQLGSTAIDVRVQPLLRLLLPTPPVVGLMQLRLRALAGCQLACIGTLSRLAWMDAPAGADADVMLPSSGSGSLVAGSFFRIFPDNAELQSGLAAMLAAQGEAINACAGVLAMGAAMGCRRALQWRLAPAATVSTPPLACHVCLAAYLCTCRELGAGPEPTAGASPAGARGRGYCRCGGGALGLGSHVLCPAAGAAGVEGGEQVRCEGHDLHRLAPRIHARGG